jgi:anti-sigma-K factor RskA
MTRQTWMSEHEQFGENLVLYALNALEGKDRAKVEEHLASCSECRLELEQLRGDSALLALSSAGPKPPARARARLLEAIAKEGKTATSGATGTRAMRHPWSRWAWLGWATAAATVVLAALLWNENSALRQMLAAKNEESAQARREVEDLRRIAAPILSPETQRVTVVSIKTAPQPQGKAFYLRSRNSLVFVANNMPQLPPHKAYQLWLVPPDGAPMPAGVFKPDARGSGTIVNPPLPAGAEAKAFAITVEVEAGALHPTTPIIMMGTGE